VESFKFKEGFESFMVELARNFRRSHPPSYGGDIGGPFMFSGVKLVCGERVCV
jgi:hypothetical protein